MAVNIFDVAFYRAANPDLANLTDTQLLQHFQNYGLREGRVFSPLVNLDLYRLSNPDLAAAGLTSNQQLYQHLQNSGVAEGRNFSEYIDIDFYLKFNPDVRAAVSGNREQAFNHLRSYGISEGRRFSPFIDISYYLTLNPDVSQAFKGNRVQALWHLQLSGLKEGRRFSAELNLDYYRTVNPDLAAAGLNNQQLLLHFETNGLQEGRASSLEFNVKVYLANNADLQSAGFTNRQAYEHFIASGRKEGRPGADYAGNTISTARSISFLNSSAISLTDFVGHGDSNDYYKLNVASLSTLNLSLSGLKANADVRLLDTNGSLVQGSYNSGNTPESINRDLSAGTYYLQVYSTSGSSNYNLNINVTPQIYKYTFTYYYNGNSDYYTGYVYARAGTYTVGSYFDYSTSNNETGANGKYYISGSTTTGTATDIGKVYVSSYYDSEAASSYTPYSVVSGSSGLGREYGYLTSAQTSSNDLFGYDYYEADVVSSTVDLKGLYFDSPEPLTAGSSFNVTFNVQNVGNVGAAAFKVGFYLSTDSNITTSDYYLGDYSFTSLAAGTNTGYLTKNLTLPVAGSSAWAGDKTYYLGMIADYGNTVSEANESNNASTGLLTDYDDVAISGTTVTNSFNIQFDYRFDTNGFFNNLARRAVLEAAATVWKNIIRDEFADVPVGTNLNVRNPQTGQTVQFSADYAIDDLVVFVGARAIGGTTLADAGPSGTWIVGSDLDRRYNNVSDFEPWTGSLSFNSSSSWFFDSTPNTANDIPGNSNDFLSVAVHEIGHILGISYNVAAFRNWVSGSVFTGSNAKYFNGGNSIPLSGDLSHIQDGFTISGMGENAMDPIITQGTRKLPTALDIALLNDIGYIVNYNAASTNL